MRRAFLAFLLSLAGPPALAQAREAPPARILFVGNSLTSSTDIPGRFEKLARAMGKAVRVESVAENGFTLEDHWRDGRAAEAIRKGWDYVVLQQATGAADGGRELTEYLKRFAKEARNANAKPALYMVWPPMGRLANFEPVIQEARWAAQDAKAILLPAGEAWLRAIGLDKRIRLYGDTVHPAELGAELAVLTIYLSIFPAGPTEFDEAYVEKAARALGMPQDRRDLLFDAATRAIDEPMRIR